MQRRCASCLVAIADRLAERPHASNDQQKGLPASGGRAPESREDMRTAPCSPKPDMSTFIGWLDWRGAASRRRPSTPATSSPEADKAFYASLDDKQKAVLGSERWRQQAEEPRGRRGRRWR